MEPEVMKELEEKLRRLHRKVGDEIKTLDDELREGMDENFKESLSSREEADVVEAEGRIEENEIHLIEGALQRIADGTYGRCTECGEAINIERLKAVPYAKCCIKCQSDMEK